MSLALGTISCTHQGRERSGWELSENIPVKAMENIKEFLVPARSHTRNAIPSVPRIGSLEEATELPSGAPVAAIFRLGFLYMSPILAA